MQEQLDASVKQRADEKSVFDVNFQDEKSVDALQRALEVVSARSDADGMALLQRKSKTDRHASCNGCAFQRTVHKDAARR